MTAVIDATFRVAAGVDINYNRANMGRHHLGAFEQTLLYALVRLGPDTSGLDIARLIESRTGRLISPGAIYAGLDRLTARQLVTSKLGEPTPQRGGKRRRLYRATPAGVARLRDTHQALGEMARGLQPKLHSS
jgi:DNA-binding PadR family transcriptional regulator